MRSPMYLTDQTVVEDLDTEVTCNQIQALVAHYDPLLTKF